MNAVQHTGQSTGSPSLLKYILAATDWHHLERAKGGHFWHLVVFSLWVMGHNYSVRHISHGFCHLLQWIPYCKWGRGRVGERPGLNRCRDFLSFRFIPGGTNKLSGKWITQVLSRSETPSILNYVFVLTTILNLSYSQDSHFWSAMSRGLAQWLTCYQMDTYINVTLLYLFWARERGRNTLFSPD